VDEQEMLGGKTIFNDRLLELVSERTGLITSLSRVARGVEEPIPPFLYHATLSNFDFRIADKLQRGASGKGCTPTEAIAGAIGEAVERYCASHFDTDQTCSAPWVTVEPDAIAPPEFVLYSATQYAKRDFQYHRWDPKDEIMWIKARELPNGRAVLVPASLVYLAGTVEYLCPSTSNGLAAGFELEDAVLRGLYELIERDGFLVNWMNRLSAPEVEFPVNHGLPGSIRMHYQRFGVKVCVFNLSTDLPAYVMMAIALDATGEGPAAVVGLGCHLDPDVALLKSLLELCQVRPSETRRYRAERPGERLKRYEDVQSLEDHSAFLSTKERLGEFDFLLETGRKQKLGDLPNFAGGNVDADLNRCLNALSERGYRVVYTDLTTPDVNDYGLHVVRVLATGLQPIHFGYGKERLGGRRLFEVPELMGLAAGPRSESELNRCPHPLA
jgi:ribosomal protein S12 methylthiotransferase accessory factor